MLNHYAVHLKLILYVNYASIKKQIYFNTHRKEKTVKKMFHMSKHVLRLNHENKRFPLSSPTLITTHHPQTRFTLESTICDTLTVHVSLPVTNPWPTDTHRKTGGTRKRLQDPAAGCGRSQTDELFTQPNDRMCVIHTGPPQARVACNRPWYLSVSCRAGCQPSTKFLIFFNH